MQHWPVRPPLPPQGRATPSGVQGSRPDAWNSRLAEARATSTRPGQPVLTHSPPPSRPSSQRFTPHPSSKPHDEDRSEPSTPSASPSEAAPSLAQLENVNGDLSNYSIKASLTLRDASSGLQPVMSTDICALQKERLKYAMSRFISRR